MLGQRESEKALENRFLDHLLQGTCCMAAELPRVAEVKLRAGLNPWIPLVLEKEDRCVAGLELDRRTWPCHDAGPKSG
jgi:hypothetical protein